MLLLYTDMFKITKKYVYKYIIQYGYQLLSSLIFDNWYTCIRMKWYDELYILYSRKKAFLLNLHTKNKFWLSTF